MDTSALKIISGGQTGADRAALDWAIEHGITHGGWCPAGRKAEDGKVPDRYQLTELPGSRSYRSRTKANVRDAGATLIISLAPALSGGSLLTVKFAEQLGKPCLHVHPGIDWRTALQTWLRGVAIHTLNVAGPRASREPAVGQFTHEVLSELLYASLRDPR